MLDSAGFYDELLHVMYVSWLLFVGGTPCQLKDLPCMPAQDESSPAA